ncbi:T6SS immunity protein Tdi1 domain-containing protein [Burkholderia ubonensis]|uniref:T6SS immunity protein Tdi1 domain-containing protein n=1 Tax=Burkholderia ubonensis TaxID=101571 RepID=UPI0009B31067|nr:T6SS immunity protein Tdi1 domain-containing protein [Burkholderia ubonensis]
MYERFRSAFVVDDGTPVPGKSTNIGFDYRPIDEFLRFFGGISFNDGIYRVANSELAHRLTEIVSAAFPVFSGRIVCFAFDWLGRIFAVDSGRSVEDERAVVMFEPGTGEALELPCNLMSFHDEELIQYRDAALAENFFLEWKADQKSPSYFECVGYKRPLFLGGSDSVENLELIDMDVYWSISEQLIQRLRDAPSGTRVKVSVDPGNK